MKVKVLGWWVVSMLALGLAACNGDEEGDDDEE